MSGKLFIPLLLVILIASFLLHIFAVKNNHFYFTVDQGRDAEYVREIIKYHKIFTKGPQTNIKGVFAGPLGDYFIAVGYFIFKGHPFGAVFMMIITNLIVSFILALWLKRYIGILKTLLLISILQIYWQFFMTSLWGFHPFPLLAIGIALTIFLTHFLKGKPSFYLYGLIIIFLGFNFEVAGSLALFIFLAGVGLIGVKAKIISFRLYFILTFGLPLIGAIFLSREFLLKAVNSTGGKSGLVVFSGTNFGEISKEFAKMIGLQILGISVILVFIYKKVQKTLKNFIFLTLLLALVAFLVFASNHGWRDWQTVYLAPLMFISLLLAISVLPKKISISLFVLVAIFEVLSFKNNYINYLNISNDNGLLSNQLKVLDYIYQNAEGNGFNAYIYTNTFYDYNYQYLFSWYGKGKFGFYPCEYSNFPLSHKELYIPGWEHYVEPKLGCDKFRFLIIESDTNGETNKDWIDEFRIEHHFISKILIGKTVVEKYKTRDIY